LTFINDTMSLSIEYVSDNKFLLVIEFIENTLHPTRQAQNGW